MFTYKLNRLDVEDVLSISLSDDQWEDMKAELDNVLSCQWVQNVQYAYDNCEGYWAEQKGED
jgi:hypothetical protein